MGNAKGQGATEYLVTLGAILLIGTVSIALLGFFPGLSADAKISQSDAYWNSARPFAILGHYMPAAAAGTADYWTFDENNGTAASDSVGSSSGTITGASWVEGKYGSALNFSSSGQYVFVPSSSGISAGSSISVDAWINPDNLTATYHTILRIGSAPTHWFLWRNNGNFYWYYYNGTNAKNKYCAYALPTGTWTHVAVTQDYSAKRITFFVNGVQLCTSTYTEDAVPPSNEYAYLGAYTSSSYYFNGAIDNLRIYSSTLSASDAASLANEGMLMVVQHNGQAYRTINTIQLGDQTANVNTGFGAGEKKTLDLAINHGTCTAGSMYEYNVTITYSSPNLAGLAQSGAQNLVGKCS